MLILNTDVRIYSNIIQEFWRLASQNTSIASITPLSTNATIASLVNWPNGGSLGNHQLSKIAESLAKLDGHVDYIDIPTGVGFCMYMAAEAINSVGHFDPVFKRGYGEECDWCRRAADHGFRNVLSLRSVVAHIGTQSFTNKEKLLALKTSEKTLLSKHSDYRLLIWDHVLENQLRFFRMSLMLSSFPSKGVVIQFLHSDPFASSAGGTEFHVRDLDNKYLKSGYSVLEVFPEGDGFGVRYIDNQGNKTLDKFYFDDLQRLLVLLGPRLAFIHVHHLKNWPDDVLDWLIADQSIRKAFTFHDFWMLCPTVNLLRYGRDYCGVEQDRVKCGDCYRRNSGFTGRDAYAHRQRLKPFLENCATLMAPSESAKNVVGLGFPEIKTKVQVVPHDLAYLSELAVVKNSGIQTKKVKIAFVGAIVIHKGGRLLSEAIPQLAKLGYELLVIGRVSPNLLSDLKSIRVVPYASSSELKKALELEKPSHIAFVSNWPETFCYALFEGLLLSEGAIPVVGPFGNPKEFVEKHGIGGVMSSYDVPALISAIEDVNQHREKYLTNILTWKKTSSIFDAHSTVARSILEMGSNQERVLSTVLYEPLMRSSRCLVTAKTRYSNEFESVSYRLALKLKRRLVEAPFFGSFPRKLYLFFRKLLK
jgi:glycosyltransferase involved in cell wall biosynthesis